MWQITVSIFVLLNIAGILKFMIEIILKTGHEVSMSFGLIGLIALYWVGAYIFAIILIGVVFENQEDKTNQTTGDNKSEHEGSPFDSKQGTFAFVLAVLFASCMYFYETRKEISREDYLQYDSMKSYIKNEQNRLNYQKYNLKEIFNNFENDKKITEKEFKEVEGIHADVKELHIEVAEREKENTLQNEVKRIKSVMNKN